MIRVLRSRPKDVDKLEENVEDNNNKSEAEKPSTTTTITTKKKITRVRDTKVKNDDKGKLEELPSDAKKLTRITRSISDKKQSSKIKITTSDDDNNGDNKKKTNIVKKQPAKSNSSDDVDNKNKKTRNVKKQLSSINTKTSEDDDDDNNNNDDEDDDKKKKTNIVKKQPAKSNSSDVDNKNKTKNVKKQLSSINTKTSEDDDDNNNDEDKKKKSNSIKKQQAKISTSDNVNNKNKTKNVKKQLSTINNNTSEDDDDNNNNDEDDDKKKKTNSLKKQPAKSNSSYDVNNKNKTKNVKKQLTTINNNTSDGGDDDDDDNNDGDDDDGDKKKKINSVKKQPAKSNTSDDKKKSTQLRQSTLKESFSKAKKRSPTKQLKTSPPKKPKIQEPIYKKIKLTDDDDKNIDDESKLYDFDYYYNISDEKIPKKRKRKPVQNQKSKKPKLNFIDTKVSKVKNLKNTEIDKLPVNNIMDTINDFHRIPLAITGKNIEVHQVPLKVKKQIVDNDDQITIEQPKQIQVVAQVHDIPVAQDENIMQKSTTPIQAFRKTNVFQGKSSGQKISDDVIEQIISQDDDDNDDDYNDTHDDMVNDINQENISTPIQAFRKTNIFDKKKSVAVDNINSMSPDIDSCQDTPNLSLTPIQAFRKTNIFNKKPLENDNITIANNSLLSQQLSPIPKQILSGIDDSTPWRPCLVPRQVSFSKVKNIVQSTPQNKNLPEFINKLIKTNADNKKIMKNKKKINENNENSNVIMMNNIIQKKKLSNSSKSPRKFGTEISNLSGSISESSLSNGQSIIDAITTTPTKTVTTTATPTKTITTTATEKEKEIIPDEVVTSPSIPIVNANIEYDELDENSENKENEITDSPKKLSPSKKNRLLIDSPRRSFGKPLSKLSVSPVKLNFGNDESQPGPSGLVKRQPLAERRITRQSNLHMFLNLPELPESTKITTADGIFDDINSNPSSRAKKIKQFKDPKMNNGVDDTDHSYDLEGQENQLRDYHPMLNNKRPKKQSNLHLLLDDSDDDDTENQIPHVTSGDVGQSDDVGEPPIDFDDRKTLNNSDNELNVNNLFGFCDDIGDESDIIATHDNTSTKIVKKINKKTTKKIGKPVIITDKPMTTRYSIIKDKKILDNEVNEKPKMNKIDAIKAHFGSTKNAVIEAHDFSDTFDFGELEQPDDVSQVPLFVDLEPVHFKQPPRYSYNRKRHYNTSGETDDDEDNNDKISENKITKKKKKISKEEREQKKQLENWAKSLNQSFNEVDEFDLIVESVND